ncbi:MAG: 3-oxoacyl-ACP reductase FabG [Gammaproteobacteria bacterium]
MKKALITGASGDIGAAVCRRLARQNIHVIAHYHQNGAQAEAVVRDIIAQGSSAQTVQFDISDFAQCKVQLQALDDGRPIQIIVHSAGIHCDAPLAGMAQNDWQRVIDVSLHGFYNVTQPLLLPMIGTRWGRIVSLSSVAAVMGNRGQANYAAAKAGLHGATKTLALELASRGITVNAVAPGIIQGHMSDSAFGKEKIKALVPMQRAGKAEEVAALVAFLCSEEAAYISGQIIGINGAMA